MEYSVTVNEELRRLVGDLRKPKPQTAAPPARPAAPPHEPKALLSEPVAMDPAAPTWRLLRLWRDGLRPLRFRGAPIFEVQVPGFDEDGGFSQRAALYLREAGAAVFAATLLPPHGLPALPSYRAFAVDSAEALERCVAACRPGACLVTAGATCLGDGPDCPLRRFETQLARLRAAVLNYVKI